MTKGKKTASYLIRIIAFLSLMTTTVCAEGLLIVHQNDELQIDSRIKDKTGYVMPVGTILPFGGSSAPEGWLLCNGSEYSRTDYPDLFSAIGTAFGASSSGTFNIPDLRGQFLRGVDAGTGTDPDAASRTELQPGGNTGDNVGTLQADDFKSHTHGGFQDRYANTSGGGSFITNYSNGHGGEYRTTASGGNETRPKNVAVHFIIKY